MQFEDFVAARGPALVRTAMAMCGDRHRAEDLVQAALTRLYPRWSRVARADAPEAVVRTAIIREFLSWRRLRSSGEIPVDGLPEQAAPAQPSHPAHDDLWAQLMRLPRRQRVVLALRYYDDLDDPTIATSLGVAEATVRSLASRGLASLRAQAPVQESPR